MIRGETSDTDPIDSLIPRPSVRNATLPTNECHLQIQW